VTTGGGGAVEDMGVGTVTRGVRLLLKVLGSDFVFDSIAVGDCVTPEGENAFK